jgi:hypothetical protein
MPFASVQSGSPAAANGGEEKAAEEELEDYTGRRDTEAASTWSAHKRPYWGPQSRKKRSRRIARGNDTYCACLMLKQSD